MSSTFRLMKKGWNSLSPIEAIALFVAPCILLTAPWTLDAINYEELPHAVVILADFFKLVSVAVPIASFQLLISFLILMDRGCRVEQGVDACSDPPSTQHVCPECGRPMRQRKR